MTVPPIATRSADAPGQPAASDPTANPVQHPVQHPIQEAPTLRRRTDWRYGGPAHPLVPGAGDDGTPAPFLSQSMSARAGITMLALGLVVVAIGSYVVTELNGGMALAALLGTGFGGLTIAVVGGFLYAGSWISCLVGDNRAANRRLAETLLALTEVTVQATGASGDVGSMHVTVGPGTVVHRRDCPLIAYRPDLAPADPDDRRLSRCRVCSH